jgi:hypothetical protein
VGGGGEGVRMPIVHEAKFLYPVLLARATRLPSSQPPDYHTGAIANYLYGGGGGVGVRRAPGRQPGLEWAHEHGVGRAHPVLLVVLPGGKGGCVCV